MFDASARTFTAKSAEDRKIIACTNRWAGVFVTDIKHSRPDGEEVCSLSVIEGGSMYNPPEYDIDILRVPCRSG